MGLAIAAVVKGYKCIFTTTDKQSKEKIDALKAFGADVIVCRPTSTPRIRRSLPVSSRLEQEVPNSWKANHRQPVELAGAHEQTGPEIWTQTDGRITQLVVGVGTGGTVSGVGRYLKEQNPAIKVWGIDTYGSVFKNARRPASSTSTRSIHTSPRGSARTSCPRTSTSPSSIISKVTDKDAAIMTRRIAREEGIFAGNSAGSAMAGCCS
jgi:cystathionine beta-synthase